MLSFTDCMMHGLRARDLMPCLCRDFAVFLRLSQKFAVFSYHFCRDFYCPVAGFSCHDSEYFTITITNYNYNINV